MRKFMGWVAFVAIIAIAGVIVFAVWRFAFSWRPRTLTHRQDEIAKALETAGWVSPHLTGPKLYMIAYRACPACIRFEAEEFPRLQAAGVDTRAILVALPDRNGQARSTAAERATVAELWTNRSWKLFQQWLLVPPEAWTAPGIAPADGDAARTAVIEAGRDLASKLPPMLKESGLRFNYPTLVWWTKDGRMRACVCEKPQSYAVVEKELAP